MKKWVVKAIVQKIISFLPNSNKINYLFQKYVTKGVILSDEYFRDRLAHGIQHIQAYKKQAGELNGNTLELGTGWYPVVPIAMFLSGAEKIITVDISPLTDKEKVLTTVKMFIEYRKQQQLPAELLINEARFALLSDLVTDHSGSDLKQILEKLRITYLNTDARHLPFPDGYFQLIHSNNTFEHIYEPILAGILKEFKRLLAPGGVMSHFIDMSDHFAHADAGITIYNYLKYSENQWKKIDNDVQPQNRMRICQYRTLYKKLSLPIVDENLRPGDITALKTLTLSAPFNNFKAEEVAVSHGYIISN